MENREHGSNTDIGREEAIAMNMARMDNTLHIDYDCDLSFRILQSRK